MTPRESCLWCKEPISICECGSGLVDPKYHYHISPMDEIIKELRSVLCDPSGHCCVLGSAEDRSIVDNCLKRLEQLDDTTR